MKAIMPFISSSFNQEKEGIIVLYFSCNCTACASLELINCCGSFIKFCIQSAGTTFVNPLSWGPIASCLKLWQPLQLTLKDFSPAAMVRGSVAMESFADVPDLHALK